MMSLENEGGSAAVSESVSAESSSGAAETSSAPVSESKSNYAVTDPGYEADIIPDAEGNELDALRAENTKEKTPSEESGDASTTDEGDTEETAETQPTDDAADSDGISDELLDRATELGYTLDEIKGFRDEKSLEKEVSRVEKLQQRLQQRQAGKTPAKTEDAPTEEAEPEPNWDELVEAGHDPDVVELQKKNWQRATKAEALVKQMYQAEQDRAWTAQCERFDESLNNLGAEYKTLFGTGRRGDLLKSSPEAAANRDIVFEKLAMLRTGYQQLGKPVPSESELIQEAVQASFYKQAQTIARKALTNQIKKAGSQALSRPNSAGTKALSGPALATAKEQDFWRKHS